MSSKKKQPQVTPDETTPVDQAADETPIEETARVDGLPGTVGQPVSVEQLREELGQAKDRVLRCQAELENYRKRAARELSDTLRYANMSIVRDLLPIWDNVGRAIEAAEQHEDSASLLEGFKMVGQQFADVLQRHHCTEIKALGEPFDPHLHEAILQQPSDEYPANTVAYVSQPGFQLHDRVVRPTQVIVSVGNE